jgi:beta-D-xylosidase 4
MQISAVLNLVFTILVDGLTPPFPDCKSGPLATFAICNSSFPFRQRTTDLVSQMVTDAHPLSRLGIPQHIWWSECLHGIAESPGIVFGRDFPSATSFPNIINLGATFNMPLVHRIASVISTKARAVNYEGRSSINFFTLNINIFRDPR